MITYQHPNGTEGRGKFFYEYWSNALDCDELFDIDLDATAPNEQNKNLIYEKFKPDADDILKTSKSNGFVKVFFHWSEDPRKDDEWFDKQCQDLNYNKRQIAQEYDIRFVGATNNPFDDEVLEALQKAVISPIGHLPLRHSARLKLFKEIDPRDYYIIGVDTASSINGCFSAIEVFSFKNFEQVGEIALRLGSLSQYGEIVVDVAEYFSKQTGGRIILGIENNSIGKSIVEDVMDTEYLANLFYEKNKIDNGGIVTEWGINTNGRTKPIMISEAYSQINNYPQYFHSQDLINQLNSIERNNAGQVSSKAYTDMFMATCFCAYIRKMKELDILPLLNFTSEEVERQNTDTIKDLISITSNKDYAVKREASEVIIDSSENNTVFSESFYTPQNPEDENVFHAPFFFK